MPRPLFTFLFAFAVLSHQVGYRVAYDSPLGLSVSGAALAAVVWPGATWTLVVLCGSVLADVVWRFDTVLNHWLFAGFLAAAVLVALGHTWLSHARAAGDTRHAHRASPGDPLRTALLGCLVALYAVAGFHKLNHDFIGSPESCGVMVGEQLLHALHLPVFSAIGPMTVVGTFVAELGLPLLLVLQRTRRAAIVASVLFHMACSVAGYPRFSALSMAALVAVVPAEEQWPAFARTIFSSWMLRVALAVTLVLSMTLSYSGTDGVYLAVQLALAMMVAVLALANPPVAMHADERTPDRRGLPPAWPSRGIVHVAIPISVPLLLVVVGMAPYVGLGTERAFGMYSNVRTEGGITNHLIARPDWQVAAFQRDLVTVLDDPGHATVRTGRTDRVMPWIEFRHRLSQRVLATPDLPVRVHYARAGVVHTVSDAQRDTLLALPTTSWQRRFLRFRAIEPSGPRRCGV